jgi:exosortase
VNALISRFRQAVTSHPVECAAGCLLSAALVYLYIPVLSDMGQRWIDDPRYTHGWLVPLFSLFLLWWFGAQETADLRPSWWGVPIVLVGLAIHAAGSLLYYEWLNAISLLPVLAGVAVLFGGWPTLRRAWPAIAFLAFMVPLPYWVETGLTHPLQRVGTNASTFTLQTFGFAVFSEGNVIRMGDHKIGVVEACSGLGMLVTFFALSTAVAIVIRRPLWERLLVIVSAVPIAILTNIIRIVVTAMMFKWTNPKLAEMVFHDLFGYLMPPLALAMLWAELRLIAWVFPVREFAEQDAVAQSSFLPGAEWGLPAAPSIRPSHK